MVDQKELIRKIEESGSGMVKFAITDIDGILRGKYIHKEKFLESVENGIGFCDVIFGWDSGDACYDNIKITGWHTGYPDAKARIDFSTYRTVPWENSIPFFLADFGLESAHRNVCPRNLLNLIDRRCQDMGFTAFFAQEFEWFNFSGTPHDIHHAQRDELRPVSPGMFGYSILRTSQNSPYVHDLFNLLGEFGVTLEGIHTETGPGVFEATILFDKVRLAADKAVLFKTGVKEIAFRHQIVPTFMAKWNSRLPGCGGHLHQSLWDSDGRINLFADEPGPNELSRHYMAGLLACLPEVLPMYAPNVNSYKRIGHGDWAPSNLTWGVDNRTASVRYIPGNKKTTRIELRVPGADSNPYLAMAASLASGLYGIKNKLKLTWPETKGNAYNETSGKLPATLDEAAERMAASEIAKELFGEEFVEHFTGTRKWECTKFHDEVTDWELKRYLEII